MDAALPRGNARVFAVVGIACCMTIGAISMLAIALGAGSGDGMSRHDGSGSSQMQEAAAYGELPLSFQPNRGQSDRHVRFVSQGAGYGLYLTRRKAVLALPQMERRTDRGRSAAERSAVLSMSLLGGRADPRISGARRLPGHVNYLVGRSRSRWRTAIPTFAAVRYSNVWPGIGMSFHGNQRHLEYDFRLSPGAHVSAIGLRFSGQWRIRIDRAGDLVIELGGGTVRQLRPVAYQVFGGERHPVASRYLLTSRGRVGIEVGAYDHRRALVIDPQLVYSTYLGGSRGCRGCPQQATTDIGVDSEGNAYLTGYTTSSDFPTTPGAVQTTNHSDPQNPYYVGENVFVAKLNPTGSGLLYSTYLGGSSGYDAGSAIAVDEAGNAYITGSAISTDFPTTPGAFQTTSHGPYNAFVAKLNPSGSDLVYSTYLGGSGSGGERASAIAVDAAGSAYVTGGTSSTDFPVTPGAFQTTGAGAFVTKLNPAGSALAYSTFLGGGGDRASAIAVDPSGDAYITGAAYSPLSDFPTTPGAFQTTNRSQGGSNAFVTKLNSVGSALLYSTYLGGSSFPGDGGRAIAVDSSGHAYVTGLTSSSDFPITASAIQRRGSAAVRGNEARGKDASDVFITKLNRVGTALLYSARLGGNHGDWGNAIALDPKGNAYVAGLTRSTDFPTTPGAFQTTLQAKDHRSGNAFVTEINPPGSGLLYSTYFGGSGDPGYSARVGDRATGIALDRAGDVYLAGFTFSTDFPATPGAFQTMNPAAAIHGQSGFAAKLHPVRLRPVHLSVTRVERRGDRIRLSGHLGPTAKGRLTAHARQGDIGRRLGVRRRGRVFLARTDRLQGGGRWRITILFRGRAGWASERVCRQVQIEGSGPRQWTKLRSRKC